MNAIEFDNVGKQYRLGSVSTGTFSHDLNRWWTMNVRHKEDPNLKIGETNDRSQKGESNYVWALKDISFSVEEGDVIGIIGKNGAGKSTLLKLLSRVTTPTVGEIRARGRIASLLEVGTGFHPEMTGRENIYMNGAIMGMTKAEITRKLDEIVDFSGCERYIDTPVKRYSSGMTVRLGFAIAAHLEPEILVVDEVLAVGDAEFQKKAIGKMQDVSSIKALCNKGIMLENGRLAYQGGILEAVTKYLSNLSPIEEGNKILDIFKIFNSRLSLYTFTINGSQSSNVFLEYPQRTLNIEIKGHFEGNACLDLETYLYSDNEILLAKKKPAQYHGNTIAVDYDDFTIEETVELPKGLTNGTYYLKWDLTHPKIDCFGATMKFVKLNITGGYTPIGVSLEQNTVGGYGFISLDFE